MKLKNNNKIRPYIKILAGLIIMLIINACVYLDTFSGPNTAKAGEEVIFKVNMHVEPASAGPIAIENTRLIVSILLPNSWNPRETVSMTYTSEADNGVMSMSLIPQNVSPKNRSEANWELALRAVYGVQSNVLNDMKWVTFQSNKLYTLQNNEDIKAVITIKTIAGPKNLKFKPSFFINHSEDGLGGGDHYKDATYNTCFEVTDGEGPVIDYCELHFNLAEPLTAKKEDFLTFSFVGSIKENDLINAQQIHFCSTAYTTDGTKYEVCDLKENTLMYLESALTDKYSIIINPESYFGIPPSAQLDKIEYTFKNETGAIEVNDEGNPFLYVFECN